MDNIDGVEIIGLIAAVLTTAAFLPQVYHTRRTKDVSGLSFPMLIMFFTGVSLWLVYGFYKKSPALILANSITVVSVILLLIYKFRYHNKKR
ncbi:MAG: SemiSWEET transporter [Bacteroidia bacterium]|nr:SemiSWEET transporter [Bacteroidia bacterium]MBT8267764.1 SemiSWEET transporter [Bacteroidia bacterium]NNF82877.1 SemiSWEET transporter [Flavobacteriaceae bacterium]NNK71417.1 SemiSWEET transporter [Flavobacteriaceae bacterium]NNL79472.1 SemiSWEET transporter [Flavobacteriaceae bacterium]